MATSSILGGEQAAEQASGRGTDALGPSDNSDSGSDSRGARAFHALAEGEIGGDAADLDSDTDAAGTGERASAEHDLTIGEGSDIAPDRIEVLGAPELSDDDLRLAQSTRGEIDRLITDAAIEDGDEDDDADVT